MRNLTFALICSTIFFSCSNSEEEIKVDEAAVTEENVIDTFEERELEIAKYTSLLFEDSLTFNPIYAEKLLVAYEDYIKHHDFEAISKEYQFKAGELAKALNQPHRSIKHFNGLIDRDPNHEKAPVALFYKAMVVGDMLGEHDNAKIFYQEFIDKYPDHPFAESAKASIELEGKNLDDIVKEFEQKNS